MAKRKKVNKELYGLETRLIHGKTETSAWDYDHHVVPPLTMSSSFRLDSAARGAEGFQKIGKGYSNVGEIDAIYVYDRMGEPNNELLQDALASAEGKDIAVTFATGMAAISAAVLFSLRAGDEVISHKTVYGCTFSLFTEWLPRFNIKVHFADLRDPQSFLPLVNEKTRLLYLESPANPTLDLLDLEHIMAELFRLNETRQAHERILSVMDNTFATPYCQRPGEFGVDIVVHSLTKGICGFGTEMGGAVIAAKEFQTPLILFRKDFGGNLSPSSAWHILCYGISTLGLRMRKQQENALKIAEYLESHEEIEKVFYPGLLSFPQYGIARKVLRDPKGRFAPGMMIYFILRGESPEAAKWRGERIMDYIAKHSYAITLAVSLGQVRTLIEHPGSMTHAAYPAGEQMALGIHPGGIRLAVGIEDPADVIRDLEDAIAKS
jgi:cystathionine beta-lyase/cystathionine gamma-synthase